LSESKCPETTAARTEPSADHNMPTVHIDYTKWNAAEISVTNIATQRPPTSGANGLRRWILEFLWAVVSSTWAVTAMIPQQF